MLDVAPAECGKDDLLSSLDGLCLPSAGGNPCSEPQPRGNGSAPRKRGRGADPKKAKHEAKDTPAAIESTPPPAGNSDGQKGKIIERSSKKYRQAAEGDGHLAAVEVLCFQCRRTKDTTVQKSMTSFFKVKSREKVESAALQEGGAEGGAQQLGNPVAVPADPNICARCRRSMVEKCGPVLVPSAKAGLRGTGELPQLKRLRGYRRTAEQQGVPFTITEHRASLLMRSNCVACGEAAPPRGHGLTRLRRWPEGLVRPERGGFMGPYAEGNVEPACTMCNMMKGYRTVRGVVECARHIATCHTPGEVFGLYPQRFRDNVSRRARSAYITNSSTHTKTHAITNEDFNRIVAQPCYYCLKEPRQPGTLGSKDRGHFNGLDRLDSTNRVYTMESVVACCGTCNIMKYRWPLEGFLEHCRKIARFNIGQDFDDDAASEVPERGEEDICVVGDNDEEEDLEGEQRKEEEEEAEQMEEEQKEEAANSAGEEQAAATPTMAVAEG